MTGNNFNQVGMEFETPRLAQNVIEFTTKLKVGAYVDQVARFEVGELQRVTRFHANAQLPDAQKMVQYLVSLLELRVRIANRQPLLDHGKFARQYRVPARWFVLLAQVGEAFDATRRFKFCPTLELNTKGPKSKAIVCAPPLEPVTLMTAEEMVCFSDELSYFLEEGYTTIAGIPRDPEGSLAFMAKTTIGDVIRGMDKDNPAYAFLAFILENEVAAESYDNLDLVFRINYSSYDTYSAAFKSYFVQTTNDLGGVNNAKRQSGQQFQQPGTAASGSAE